MTLPSRKIGVAIVVFSLIAICATKAQANIDTIRDSDNQVWGSVGTSFLNYKEAIPAPDLPDSEHGQLPSLAGGVDVMLDNGLFLAGDVAVSFGDANYNGAYLISPTTSLQSTTHETITTVDGKIGQGFPVGRMVVLIPYLEVGYRYWDRNLGAGQVEDYQNFDTLGGLMAQLSPAPRWILTAYGSAGTTLGAQMKTDGTNYDLGDAGMYKIGGKVGFDLTQRIELFTTLDYDHYHYAQSPIVFDSNADAYFNEPGSRTSDTAVRVGVGYHFR